ncbi:MAG: hypothetical protein WCI02_17875, partial [Planctomycetota bacterium]
MQKSLFGRNLKRVVSKQTQNAKARRRFRSIALEGLEHKHLMAADIIFGDEPVRQLYSPPDQSTSQNSDNRAVLEPFLNRTNQWADTLVPGGIHSTTNTTSQLALVASGVQQTHDVNLSEASNAAWQDWGATLSKTIRNDPSTNPGSSILASVEPIRQMTSAWPSDLKGDSNQLLTDSPIASRPSSEGVSEGFDPSTFWFGANLAGDPQTRSLFQPIGSGGESVPIDPSRFLGTHSSSLSSFVPALDGNTEGEGTDNPSPLSLPTQGLPSLRLAGTGFRIDQYVPDFNTSNVSSGFVGAFNAQTTSENADLKLPGLSWVHTVDRSWTSPTQWSITETIVLAFNASVSNTVSSNVDSSSTSSASQTPTHFRTGSGLATFSASRSTYLIVSIHAERGITSDPAAGVAWSLHSSSRDTRTLNFMATASTNVNPNPNYVDPTWHADGTVQGRTNDPNGPVPVPRNYTSGASISAGFNIGVSTGGSLDASATPSLVPDTTRSSGFDIETDFSYSKHRLTSVELGLSAGVGFYSSSGNINATVPILGRFNESSTGGLRLVGNGDNSDVPVDTPPIPSPTSGVGHSLGTSSTSNSNTRS